MLTCSVEFFVKMFNLSFTHAVLRQALGIKVSLCNKILSIFSNYSYTFIYGPHINYIYSFSYFTLILPFMDHILNVVNIKHLYQNTF